MSRQYSKVIQQQIDFIHKDNPDIADEDIIAAILERDSELAAEKELQKDIFMIDYTLQYQKTKLTNEQLHFYINFYKGFDRNILKANAEELIQLYDIYDTIYNGHWPGNKSCSGTGIYVIITLYNYITKKMKHKWI